MLISKYFIFLVLLIALTCLSCSESNDKDTNARLEDSSDGKGIVDSMSNSEYNQKKNRAALVDSIQKSVSFLKDEVGSSSTIEEKDRVNILVELKVISEACELLQKMDQSE